MTSFKNIDLPPIFRPFRCNDLVRLGQDYDGGYIVNRTDVEKSDILISVGIKDDWSFERDFSQINDCEMVSLDRDSQVPSDDPFYVGHRQMIYKNVGIRPSYSEDLIPFEHITSIKSNKIFLKIDIEGEEYEFLDLIIQNSNKFSAISLEFHYLSDDNNFDNLINFVSKIDQKLVHFHPNNCGMGLDKEWPHVIELSFTSSDNISYDSSLTLPHSLDMPCCPQGEDYKINFLGGGTKIDSPLETWQGWWRK